MTKKGVLYCPGRLWKFFLWKFFVWKYFKFYLNQCDITSSYPSFDENIRVLYQIACRYFYQPALFYDSVIFFL